MDLTFTYLRDHDRTEPFYKAATKGLEWHLNNPDPGSEFETTVQKLGNIPVQQKITRLLAHGYDVLFSLDGATMANFLALRHRTEHKPTSVFRVYTHENYRGNGIGAQAVQKLMHDCFAQGHTSLRVGEGKSEGVIGVLNQLKTMYQGPYTIDVTPDTGWIKRI
jgi:GNAT superfamily N-acetyltransferase